MIEFNEHIMKQKIVSHQHTTTIFNQNQTNGGTGYPNKDIWTLLAI